MYNYIHVNKPISADDKKNLRKNFSYKVVYVLVKKKKRT